MARFGSLRWRLLLGAFVFLMAALIGAGIAIDAIMRHFVRQQIERRLDAQLLTLAAAIETDTNGALRLSRNVDVAPFDRPFSGWYWQVAGAGQTLNSRSSTGTPLKLPPASGTRLRTIHTKGPSGPPLIGRTRTLTLPDDAGTVSLVATAPEAEQGRPIYAIRKALVAALGTLGALLIGAAFLQVHFGLVPLRRLSDALRAVRAGESDRISGPQPKEVEGLVEEVNALIAQNAEKLERARTQVANLAHSLKTPLAGIAASLDTPDLAEHAPEALRLVALIDRNIAHHLRRARAAAVDGPSRTLRLVGQHIEDLVVALGKIYAPKAITVDIKIPPDARVACDPLDLDEMLGNLLDNSFKWARGRVEVTAQSKGATFLISIRDDGPGLGVAPEVVLARGVRADTSVPGTGFGLPITQELAGLYGGSLVLNANPGGGVEANLTLPAADNRSAVWRSRDPSVT